MVLSYPKPRMLIRRQASPCEPMKPAPPVIKIFISPPSLMLEAPPSSQPIPLAGSLSDPIFLCSLLFHPCRNPVITPGETSSLSSISSSLIRLRFVNPRLKVAKETLGRIKSDFQVIFFDEPQIKIPSIFCQQMKLKRCVKEPFKQHIIDF